MPGFTKGRRLRAAVAALLAGASTVVMAGGVEIRYELGALAAPDSFEYRYTLTNVSLATPLRWFSVDFDPATFAESSLSIASAGLASWSEQILASVPVFGVPAQYDAFKQTGSALGIGESATGFMVRFAWTGAGTPGSQAFSIYDPTTFDVIASGQTSAADDIPPAVPEPASTAMLLAGLGVLGAVARRRAGASARAAARR